MEITLTNQIVILDEAHNIEDSSREASSFSVAQAQLLDAMNDLETIGLSRYNCGFINLDEDFSYQYLWCLSVRQSVCPFVCYTA